MIGNEKKKWMTSKPREWMKFASLCGTKIFNLTPSKILLRNEKKKTILQHEKNWKTLMIKNKIKIVWKKQQSQSLK